MYQRELQAQLSALYEEETKHRLSERSCVAIIFKLQEKGELDLVFTLDGKEFLTQEQLETEIKREVHHHGGRLDILELQPLLSVDNTVIDHKIRSIASTHHNYHIVQGEVLTK
jgi:hypothetical protein